MKKYPCNIYLKRRLARLASLVAEILLLTIISCPVCFALDEKKPIVENAAYGVVRVVMIESDGDLFVGSAFGVGKAGKETDTFVTNWHVVTEDEESTPNNQLGKEGIVFIALNDGEVSLDQLIPCRILYRSHYPDMAVIQAERPVEGRVALPLMASRKAARASTVYTIGYPGSADTFSSGHFLASVESSTITTGTIAKFIEMPGSNTWVVQHGANFSGGNSGGPLLTAEGAVIGINTYSSVDTAYITDSEGNILLDERGNPIQVNAGQGVSEYNFSVFIDYAMDALDQLGIPYDVYQDWSVLILPGIVAGTLAFFIFFYVVYTKVKPARKWKPDPEMYRLQCVSGVFAPKRFQIRNPTRIGRDPGRNDLVYPGESSKISGTHCRLLFEGKQLYLEDLNSKNGTYRDGIKIPVMAKVPVEAGSTFSLGDSSELFRIEVTAKK